MLEKLGVSKEYLYSPDGQISRHTTQEILDIMCMTYAGLMNKKIVTKFQQFGMNAVGLCGIDGRLIQGKRHTAILTIEKGKKKVIHDDLTGTVENINLELLGLLVNKGFIPVITPPAISEENQQINVDGDKIAAKITIGLQADTLLFFIEAPGFLQDVKDDNSCVKKIPKKEIERYLPFAQGRMKKKLIVSKWALASGVKQVIIADGRKENPISNVVIHKKGTVIL